MPFHRLRQAPNAGVTALCGKNYDVDSAYDEGRKLMNAFGATVTNYAVGGVTRNGVVL